MEEYRCEEEDFILKNIKSTNFKKGTYSLLLISDEDRKELISALINYYNQLRKKRLDYVKRKEKNIADVQVKLRHKEPKMFIAYKYIDNAEAKIIAKKSAEHKVKKIEIIPALKDCSKEMEKELKRRIEKKLGKKEIDESDNSSSDNEPEESDNSEKE
jgi:hypothetical protein